MRRLLTVVFGCWMVLVAPRTAFAELFEFHLGLDPMDLTFDAGSFRWVTQFNAQLGGELAQGPMEFVSGPLLDLDVVFDGEVFRSVYTYGPGDWSMTGSWTCGGVHWPCDAGLPQTGSFAGTFEGVTISLCEGCSLFFPGATGDVFMEPGAGLFDAAFASLLGGDRGGGSSFEFPIDGVTGDPESSQPRAAGSPAVDVVLGVDAYRLVPEPGVTVLALASAVALLMRHRRLRSGRYWTNS